MIENHVHEGQNIPDVVFRTRENGRWIDLPSAEVFGGKTVVVFALPGAFTPTCSASHLPRYEELAPALRARGVDDVLCISVNDAFVMEAWAAQNHLRHVRLLPDGSGRFTEAMGMLVDKGDLDFGRRSWRYSMLVRDGVIEKMFVEPEVEGDPFQVSDADTMLAHLDPKAPKPPTALMFSRAGCPHCARAREILESRGIRFEEVVVGRDVTTSGLRAASGESTVPQVFFGGRRIGGADALEVHFRNERSAA